MYVSYVVSVCGFWPDWFEIKMGNVHKNVIDLKLKCIIYLSSCFLNVIVIKHSMIATTEEKVVVWGVGREGPFFFLPFFFKKV
jgi:hypothetical protein